MCVVEQKRVVAGTAVDLGVNDMQAVVQQREDNLARTRRRETPVGRKTGYEESWPWHVPAQPARLPS
jgi:hypothetical protein